VISLTHTPGPANHKIARENYTRSGRNGFGHISGTQDDDVLLAFSSAMFGEVLSTERHFHAAVSAKVWHEMCGGGVRNLAGYFADRWFIAPKYVEPIAHRPR
jgi:hypothetical protein